jgi:hypothetical protein
MITNEDRKEFLKKDLSDTLCWLYVGAVTWKAAPPNVKHERCPHQRALGMFMTFMQARALYEFFYNPPKKRKNPPEDGDSVWAGDFTTQPWNEPESHLYKHYMGNKTPAQKRAFHLAYGRSGYSGGTGDEGADHLNNQIVEFAKDLHRLTEKFAKCVKPQFRESVEIALKKAFDEAEHIAISYGISNPI